MKTSPRMNNGPNGAGMLLQLREKKKYVLEKLKIFKKKKYIFCFLHSHKSRQTSGLTQNLDENELFKINIENRRK